MKKIVALGVVGIMGLVGGCSSKKPAAAVPVQPQYTDIVPAQPVHQGYPTGGAYGGGGNAYGGGNTGAVVPVTDNWTPPAAGPTIVDTKPTKGSQYTVKKGDTLWSIAQRSYGDGKQYKKIVSANPNIKGDKVNVGQVITLP